MGCLPNILSTTEIPLLPFYPASAAEFCCLPQIPLVLTHFKYQALDKMCAAVRMKYILY